MLCVWRYDLLNKFEEDHCEKIPYIRCFHIIPKIISCEIVETKLEDRERDGWSDVNLKGRKYYYYSDVEHFGGVEK